jgi:CreA protein
MLRVLAARSLIHETENEGPVPVDERPAASMERSARGMKAHNAVMKRFLFLTSLAGAFAVHAERVGEVDTVFKLIGPDHKIVVDAYDDPDVKGITCYVSRAKTGGIKGGLGLAEDKAEASIACRQTGPISFPKPLKRQDEMFSERISLVFKRLRVVRMVDAARNTLVYLTYSDRVIEGSPQNSVTAVPVDRGTPIPVR